MQQALISSVITQSRVIERGERGVVVDGCCGSVAEPLGLTPLWHHLSFFSFAVLKVLGQ